MTSKALYSTQLNEDADDLDHREISENLENLENLEQSNTIEMQQQQQQQQQHNDSIDLLNNNNNMNERVNERVNKKEIVSEAEHSFFKFKQHVKNKRKATFCCIFSIGSLILSIILLLAPLSTQMIEDWKLYNTSIHTQCKIISIDANNDNHGLCTYQYERTDNHQFNEFCGLNMHETASCDYYSSGDFIIDDIGECCFYQNNDKHNQCEGTMINTLTLHKNNNIFVVLLAIGTTFSLITICSGIYGSRLCLKSGIYCSIISIQRDDNNIFELMQKLREEYRRYPDDDISSSHCPPRIGSSTIVSTINTYSTNYNLQLSVNTDSNTNTDID